MCTATLLVNPMNATDAEVGAAAEAALAAGFQEASVWAQHLPAVAASGLRVGVIEAGVQWANGTPGAAQREADRLAELAMAHRAARVLAVCMDPQVGDDGRARRNLAALVDRVASAGASVCLEFLPGTGVPDLATAWALVEPLPPDAAVLLDAWHWTRQPGGPAPEVLQSIPGDRVGYVQLCDAAPAVAADVMTEAMTGRLLPGEGTVDFGLLFALLEQIDARPYVATEVFNPALVQRLGPAEAARAMRASAEKVLALQT